jgi:hypothetical protein
MKIDWQPSYFLIPDAVPTELATSFFIFHLVLFKLLGDLYPVDETFPTEQWQRMYRLFSHQPIVHSLTKQPSGSRCRL